jgi:hypothetical protein
MTTLQGEIITTMNDSKENFEEILVNERVTYTLQVNGKFYLIENVPARINEETGEHLFSPSIVKNLQHIIMNGKEPDRTIETPVYDYKEYKFE